jgi:PAS domain S-box-containing protein
MQSYEKASQGARENGYLSEAGLAHALAAEFYQDLGLHQAALHNLEQAALAWQSWGAHALVESLSHRFADLLEVSGLSWQSSSDAGKVQTTTTPLQLDLESITRASQLLSAETDLEQLLAQMISLVMANSGAERAVLLLKQENEWFVQARGDIVTEESEVLLNQTFDPADSETDLIPEPVFNYCQRSKEALVVGDAQLDHRLAEDRMIQDHKIQSIACLPALSQGELKAMLYLENRQTADVFTSENVEILKHLSAQFAISVENALLYDNLSQLVEERTAHLQNEIEERKQAEVALQESEKKYRDLVEKISDVIYTVDAEGVITYLNPAIELLIGLPPEQVVGQPFGQFIHPEDLGSIQGNVQTLLSGGAPGTAEYRLLTASGETRWIRVTSQPVVDGDQVTGIQGVLTDITERKRVEAQLEEAATAAERERLARELHDSVTQVLFSATLVAEVLPQIWRRDPEKGFQSLDKLRRYTRGALAEMRTMLHELRPSAIINTPLGELLGQLTEAVTGRTGVPFKLSIEQIPSLPEDVQTNFYRIAQEALNNVVKHAQANLVTVSLNATPLTPDSTGASGYRVKLVIQDDGVGFVSGEIQSDRMGIGIMHERAAAIHATLSLESQLEHGTRVTLIWSNEWGNP